LRSRPLVDFVLEQLTKTVAFPLDAISQPHGVTFNFNGCKLCLQRWMCRSGPIRRLYRTSSRILPPRFFYVSQLLPFLVRSTRFGAAPLGPQDGPLTPAFYISPHLPPCLRVMPQTSLSIHHWTLVGPRADTPLFLTLGEETTSHRPSSLGPPHAARLFFLGMNLLLGVPGTPIPTCSHLIIPLWCVLEAPNPIFTCDAL